MEHISLERGYRVWLRKSIQHVHGYEPESDFPVITIGPRGIQSVRHLPEDFAQAADLVNLYSRCIKEYRLMLAEELYSL